MISSLRSNLLTSICCLRTTLALTVTDPNYYIFTSMDLITAYLAFIRLDELDCDDYFPSHSGYAREHEALEQITEDETSSLLNHSNTFPCL